MLLKDSIFLSLASISHSELKQPVRVSSFLLDALANFKWKQGNREISFPSLKLWLLCCFWKSTCFIQWQGSAQEYLLNRVSAVAACEIILPYYLQNRRTDSTSVAKEFSAGAASRTSVHHGYGDTQPTPCVMSLELKKWEHSILRHQSCELAWVQEEHGHSTQGYW